MSLNNLILKIKQKTIKRQIKRGKLKLINQIDLKDDWIYHPLICALREKIVPVVEERLKQSYIPFDPQDLEHQILFRLTTFSPRDLFGQKIADELKYQVKFWQDIENLKIENLEINREIFKNILEEQYLIIAQRMKHVDKFFPLSWLMRGLSGRNADLNRFNRLILHKEKGHIFAIDNQGYRREVELKKVEDKELIVALINSFHYIHSERSHGDIFAFFFKGDSLPWGIETTERSCHSRPYKRLALLANGIHPDKAIELTRYYTLPGSPRNSISVIDGWVRDYYSSTDIEALMTCTMPTYAKTKSSTIAGGINQLLFVKPTYHQFIKIKIGDKIVWQHATKRLIEEMHYRGEIIRPHPEFFLYPTFEVYVIIKKKTTFNKLPELENKIISFL